jgi:hypothetical protein
MTPALPLLEEAVPGFLQTEITGLAMGLASLTGQLQ